MGTSCADPARTTDLRAHLAPTDRDCRCARLEEVAQQVPGRVVQAARAEHLVVQEVVRQPARLLPEQRQQRRRRDQARPRAAAGPQHGDCGPCETAYLNQPFRGTCIRA